MAKKTQTPLVKRVLKRTHRENITLNDEEFKFLNRYMEKFKISNKSKFIRETLMRTIIVRFEEDHPTLFD